MFVTGLICSTWLVFVTGFKKRHNLLKNGMWEMMLITVGCVYGILEQNGKGGLLDMYSRLP